MQIIFGILFISLVRLFVIVIGNSSSVDFSLLAHMNYEFNHRAFNAAFFLQLLSPTAMCKSRANFLHLLTS